MIHLTCILNARKGDEVELFLPANRYGGNFRQNYEVVGLYDLKNSATSIPVLRVDNQHPMLQSYYYPSDVLRKPLDFPFKYCIPMHDDYLEYAVVKIYKKKFLEAKKLAEDKYIAEYYV